MTDLSFQSATDLVKAIKSRKIRSIELLEHYIDRMQRYNPKINAIVATDLENARQRCLAADKALDKGENWGVLHIWFTRSKGLSTEEKCVCGSETAG